MTTIGSLDIRSLTNEEAYAFMNEVARQLEDVFKTQPDACKAFVASLSAFNEVRLGDTDLITSTELNEVDTEADNCWRAMNQYLSAMICYPKDDVRKAAEVVYDVFNRIENPTSKPFAIEYANMEHLIDDLNKIPLDIRTLAGAQVWIEDLNAKCKAFTDLYKLRIQEKAGKVTGLIKTAKLEAVAAYREMVKVINALLVVAPTPELETFANRTNQLIDDKRIILKSMKTRSANAKLANGDNA